MDSNTEVAQKIIGRAIDTVVAMQVCAKAIDNLVMVDFDALHSISDDLPEDLAILPSGKLVNDLHRLVRAVKIAKGWSVAECTIGDGDVFPCGRLLP